MNEKELIEKLDAVNTTLKEFSTETALIKKAFAMFITEIVKIGDYLELLTRINDSTQYDICKREIFNKQLNTKHVVGRDLRIQEWMTDDDIAKLKREGKI
jgi:hypothetical protein